MLRPTLVPYACGAGAILCWASLAAAIGESLRVAPPEAVLFWGLLLAGLALSAWELARAHRPHHTGAARGPWLWPENLRWPESLRWPGWRAASWGLYGIWGYHTLLVLAFAHAPAVEANVVNYAWTLWIVVLGSFLPGHRLTGRIALAGLLGFAGVALVIGGDHWWHTAAGPSLDGHMLGFALAFAAAFTRGSFTVLLRRMVPGEQPRMAMFCLLAAGAALVFAMVRGVPLTLPPAVWPAVGYLGVVPLGLSFVLWERAAQGAQLQVLGLMSFFTPVLSTALLSAVSGVGVGVGLALGLALILAGAALGGTGVRRGTAPHAA